MKRLKFDQDILPLSEFRSGVASFLKQVHDTKRPLVITQRGRGVAVLIDVHEYEAMQDRMELMEDICRADQQLLAGEGVGHEEAKARVLQRLQK
jgi:antitoxin YefM